MHECVCLYTCVLRHTTSACMFVCMPVCVCIHVYVSTCGICAYYLHIQMHPCVCICENTESSYVRCELLEDGRETLCHKWKI